MSRIANHDFMPQSGTMALWQDAGLAFASSTRCNPASRFRRSTIDDRQNHQPWRRSQRGAGPVDLRAGADAAFGVTTIRDF